MKKTIRTVAAIASLFTATALMASEPRLETDEKSKSVVFRWEGEREMTSLKFIDDTGRVIYSDSMTPSKNYGKRFNLESLPYGDYTLEVENALKEIVYALRLTKNGIIMLDSDESPKPIYRKVDGMLFLSLLNLKQEEVKVTIFDSLGRALYKETFNNTMFVEKAFNFKNAFEGEYSIVVKKDTDTYYKTIEI